MAGRNVKPTRDGQLRILVDRTRELLETLWPKVQEHYWLWP
ncbi:MAG TPA: hypothetical protein VM389_14895 [Phycisphaerae bacterium]|nr:hypothetical protein [Phycisphaerae bacterium]